MASNETQQALRLRLRDLGKRFRRTRENAENGPREMRATEATGGPLLQRLCDAKLLNLVLPDVPEQQWLSDDNSAQWAGVWQQGIQQLSLVWRDYLIINPLQVDWEYRGGPEQLRVGTTKSTDWRIRAENYAAVCDALADALEPTSKSQGRPTGTRGKRWRDIESALLNGENPNDVASRLDETPNYVNKIRRQLEADGKLIKARKGTKMRK